MFISLTEHIHKQQILSLFTNESNLRVVIATVAFGMGVDCSNVRQIIHIGLPDDVCCYIQETGRAGRDGNTSVVTLLLSRCKMFILPVLQSLDLNFVSRMLAASI